MSIPFISNSFVREDPPGSRRLALWLAGFVFLCFIYFLPRWHDWNQDARMDMTLAVVNHGTIAINPYELNTGDDDYYRGNYYSNKAPGQSLAGVPVDVAFQSLLDLPPIRVVVNHMETNTAWNMALEDANCLVYAPKNYCRFVAPKLDFALLQYLESITTAAVPATLLVVLLFFLLAWFTNSLATRLTVAGIVGLGTIVFPYAQNFYSHVPATLLCFCAFALIYLSRTDSRVSQLNQHPAIALFLAGIASGLSAVFEYPALLTVPILGLFCLREFGLRRTIWFAAGVIPAICIDLAYNFSAYGDPFSTGYGCAETRFHEECSGIGGFTLPPDGNAVSGLSLSRYRGLFFLSPFLLLAIPGYVLWYATRREERSSLMTTLAIPVAYFVAICCYWGWNGGQVVGPRYIAPVIPFLAIPTVFVLDRARGLPAKIAIYGLGAMSICNIWFETIGGRQFGWSTILDPLFGYNIPQIFEGQVPLNLGTFLGLTGWRSLLPLVLFLAAWSAAILGRLPQFQPRAVPRKAVGY